MTTARPTFHNLPEDKQARIIEAALTEFASKGYPQASLNAIVARAGIAKGSLYQYFPDKQGFFLYIFDFAIALVRRVLVEVKEKTAEGDFFTRLEQSLWAGVRFIRQYPQVYALYLKILFDPQVPQREGLLRQVRQFAADYLRSLVRQGIARGELRADLPLETTIFLVDALLDRFLQALTVPAFDATLHLERAAPEVVGQRIRELMALLRRGLAATTRHPAAPKGGCAHG